MRKFPKRRSIGFKEWAEVIKLALVAAIRGEDPGYNGKVQKKFKSAFLSWFNNGRGILEVAGSGTNAIFVGVSALDLPKGSTIHVSPITDPGTIAAIILAGHRVNVLDTESIESGQTSLESLRANYTRDSSAVVLIHHAGWTADSKAFRSFCDLKGLALFEDFSQSMGALTGGKFAGCYGHISAASTMYRKTLVTGGSGGIIFSENESYLKNICLYKDRGKPIWKDDFYDNFMANRDGNNVQLAALNHNQDDINLAIGLSSLRRIDSVIHKRRFLVQILRSRLKDAIHLPSGIESSSPFIIPVTFETPDLKELVANDLENALIPCNSEYRFNVAKWNWIVDFSEGSNKTVNADSYLDRTIFLYVNERYSRNDINYIADKINHVAPN